MDKEYYDAQVKYINEIRSIRHDIQAHMIVLQYYLEAEKYDKAKDYLCDMKQHQGMQGLVIKDTGNDLVNAILSDTLNRSNVPITFEMIGILPEYIGLSEYDICTLFSNLFSNAREACERLNRLPRKIQMQVEEEENLCRIAIQNPKEWKLEMNEAGFVSSKADKENHGIGIRNIMDTVRQNHGKINFLITDETFRVEMSFEKM